MGDAPVVESMANRSNVAGGRRGWRPAVHRVVNGSAAGRVGYLYGRWLGIRAGFHGEFERGREWGSRRSVLGVSRGGLVAIPLHLVVELLNCQRVRCLEVRHLLLRLSLRSLERLHLWLHGVGGLVACCPPARVTWAAGNWLQPGRLQAVTTTLGN